MNNKGVVLITGCNGGIGQSLCQVFKDVGNVVIGTDLHEKAMIDCNHYIQCDLFELSVNDNMQQMLVEAVQQVLLNTGSCFHALINNAAYQVVKPLKDLPISEFNLSQQINVVAPFVLAGLFEQALRDAKGSIVNIGSIHAHLTKPGFCAYSTSKAAISGLTRALALDLGDDVNVNTIQPAATKTEMLLAGFEHAPEKYAQLEAYHPVGRIAEPEEIAELALFLCSEKARFITGAEIPIDGGIGSRLHDPV